MNEKVRIDFYGNDKIKSVYVQNEDTAWSLRMLDQILWMEKEKSIWAKRHPIRAQLWILGIYRPNIDWLANYPGKRVH